MKRTSSHCYNDVVTASIVTRGGNNYLYQDEAMFIMAEPSASYKPNSTTLSLRLVNLSLTSLVVTTVERKGLSNSSYTCSIKGISKMLCKTTC